VNHDDRRAASVQLKRIISMKRTILIPVLLSALLVGLAACDKPTLNVGTTTPKAVPGPAGPAGPAGATGKQGVTGDQGYQGAQGNEGMKGNTGDTGEKGEEGGSTTVVVTPAAPPNG
jgi:hypothetical protein